MTSQGNMKEYGKYTLFATLFGFGGSVNGSMTYYLGIPAAYLAYLGASVTQIGSLAAIQWAGFAIPQLWAAYATENRTIKKRFMAAMMVLSGATWLIVGGNILLFGAKHPSFSIWLFLVMFVWAVSCVGMFMPANFSLIFKITPTSRLGQLLGIVFAVQFLGSFLGGFAIRAVNGASTVPMNYAALFFITFLFSVLIACILLWIREPQGEQITAERSFPDYLRKCARVIYTDRLFLRFLVAKWLMSGHYVIMAFFLVYLIRTRGFDPINAGWLTSLNALGLAIAGFTITRISDRFGPKYMLMTSQIIALIYASIIWLVPSPDLIVIFIAFTITGFVEMSDNVGYTNMCMFCCPTEDKSTYVAVTNVGIIPFMVILPVVMGRLIDSGVLTYHQTFGIAIGMMIAAIAYIFWFVDNPPGFVRMKTAVPHTPDA